MTGFLGPNGKPQPIPDAQAARMLDTREEAAAHAPKQKISVDYEIGDAVKVLDGPFASFNGFVEELDFDRGRVKVSVASSAAPRPSSSSSSRSNGLNSSRLRPRYNLGTGIVVLRFSIQNDAASQPRSLPSRWKGRADGLNYTTRGGWLGQHFHLCLSKIQPSLQPILDGVSGKERSRSAWKALQARLCRLFLSLTQPFVSGPRRLWQPHERVRQGTALPRLPRLRSVHESRAARESSGNV